MTPESLIGARKTAEHCVADMPDGILKTAAFETILMGLIQRLPYSSRSKISDVAPERAPIRSGASITSGTTGRLLSLLDEGFFREPRSLADVRAILGEKGWRYQLEDLGTPMARLVRRRLLRRARAEDAGKKIWRYSNY
jgi:hypothetical protein